MGYLLFIITVPLTILTINASCNRLNHFLVNNYRNIYSIKTNFTYVSSNKLFSVLLDSSFRCKNTDIGDYVVSCDRLYDDSFIGIYNYDISNDNEKEIEEKLDFHIKQTIDYITEKEYEYKTSNENDLIKIEYNNNVIIITQKNYLVGDNKYSLIILKEVLQENVNYEEYQKMIDSIKFLNYNEGVSS